MTPAERAQIRDLIFGQPENSDWTIKGLEHLDDIIQLCQIAYDRGERIGEKNGRKQLANYILDAAKGA